MQDTLKNKFNAEVSETIKIMKKEVYTPTRFIRMLYESGNNAFEAVQKLVTKEVTTGIEKLYEKGRLDLSVEALIIKPTYRGLFPSNVVDVCIRKLKKLGYKKY